jgi:hypothetical protein
MLGIADITLVSLEDCTTRIVSIEVLDFLPREAITIKQAIVSFG